MSIEDKYNTLQAKSKENDARRVLKLTASSDRTKSCRECGNGCRKGSWRGAVGRRGNGPESKPSMRKINLLEFFLFAADG